MNLKSIPTSEILAELYERQGQYITKKPVIDSPEKVAQIFIDLTDTKITTESVWMLTLNVKNRLINKHLLTDGIPGAATIEPQRIFRTAMDDYASAIVLVHNHPSGDTNPSRQDVNITESVAKAECECYNRPNLDGKRHSVLIREPDSTNYTVFLCPDCFDYLAHGHLDWWNGEINTK